MIKQSLTVIFSSVLAAIGLGSCMHSQPYHNCEGAVWATTYHITYCSDHVMDDSILSVMRMVEMSLSPFADSSLVSRINRNETDVTDSLFRRILVTSKDVNRLSGGAYDPTVAPLVNLWGFGYKNAASEPEQSRIDSALRLVGIAGCHIDNNRIVKQNPLTEFDFSSITKGYGCDLIGEMLSRHGCKDYLVEIGGEVSVRGKNPRGEMWRIMIDAPVENDTAVIHKRMALIEVTDCGVATSGNYRNFRNTANGKTWHTISPSTGYPVKTSTLSATVIARDAMTADALATACMAMSLESALGMIKSLPATEALLVTADSTGYRMHTTPGFPPLE